MQYSLPKGPKYVSMKLSIILYFDILFLFIYDYFLTKFTKYISYLKQLKKKFESLNNSHDKF
jgi:hypothetical protein